MSEEENDIPALPPDAIPEKKADEDEEDIPGLPPGMKLPPKEPEGMLDHMLDMEIPDGTNGEVRRARAGLEGDWVPGSYSLSVNWDDVSTFDDGGGWDDAILLDD